MKKNYGMKQAATLIALAMMISGCASSPAVSSKTDSTKTESTVSTDSTKSESKESSQPVETGSLLDELIANASDDAKAEETWMKIFKNTANYYQMDLETEGDGEIYEYVTGDDSDFVKDHLVLKNGRDNVQAKDGGSILGADLIDNDDSYNQIESGKGLISRLGSKSTSVNTDLSDTHDDMLTGKIVSVDQNVYTKEDYPAINLRDAMVNCGFVRPVDPVRNASLYNFNLSEKGNGYELRVEVKDMDAFHEEAKSAALIENGWSGRDQLGLDQITGETFLFEFSKDGILEQSSSNTFHAVYSGHGEMFVNVRNVTEIEHLGDDKAEFVKAINDFMNQVDAGDLKTGSNFTIKEWM